MHDGGYTDKGRRMARERSGRGHTETEGDTERERKTETETEEERRGLRGKQEIRADKKQAVREAAC